MLSTLGVVASLVVAQKPYCTSLDYKVIRGACENGKRKVEWVKQPRLEVWNCDGKEIISRPDENCDCVPDDLTPVYKKNLIMKWVPRLGKNKKPVCTATATIPTQLPSGDTITKCTTDDIGFEYTDCDPETMQQQIVSYYIKHCEPAEQTVSLDTLPEGMDLIMSVDKQAEPSNYFIKLVKDAAVPVLEGTGPGLVGLSKYIGMEITAIDDQPVTLADLPKLAKGTGKRTMRFIVQLPPARTIDCHMQCEAGTYLAPPMSSCGYCPKGTYSIRGDIYNVWTNDSWPSNFATRCYAAEVRQWECNSWTMRGSYIDSGDQPLHRSTTSIFNMLVDIVTQPAQLTFKMKRDLAAADNVALFVNNKLAKFWRGGTSEWTEQKVEITVAGCTWKVTLYKGTDKVVQLCVYRNQFTPFRDESNFPYVMLKNARDYELVHLNADGCKKEQYDGHDVKDKVVFVHRDKNKACSFVEKGRVAQDAGAAGVIVTDFLDEAPIIMGGNSSGLNIPMASIKFADGKTLLAHLQPGMHVKVGRTLAGETSAIVQFVVARDRKLNQYGGKVMLKELEVTGTKYAAEECKECPQGHYSLGGVIQAEGCSVCPAGTYSQQGSHECKSCPSGKTSVPGSSICVDKGQCEKADYVPTFGPCVTVGSGAFMNLTWACTGKPGTPPADETIPCGPGEKGDCMRKGYIRNADNTCTPCLSDTVTNADQTKCVTCPESKIPQLVYDMSKGFDALGYNFLSDAWSTKCKENCATSSGWEFSLLEETASTLPQTALVAGAGVTSNRAVDLIHTFTAKLGGAIKFTYRVVADGELAAMRSKVSVTFQIYRLKDSKSDGGKDTVVKELMWESDNLLQATGSLEHEISPGEYEVVWRYQKTVATAKPVVFSLTGLTVFGSNLGSGASCNDCPAGHFCTANSVQPCAAGKYRAAGSNPTTCTPCPAGSVAKEGSAQCTPCPSGMKAAGDPPACKLADSCRWVSPKGDTFDFNPIQGASDEAPAKFIVNLCGKSPSCGKGALACAKDAAESVSYGTSAAIEQVDSGITIRLTEGDACPVDPSRQLGAVVKVVCDPIKQEEYTAHSKVSLVDSKDVCMPVYKMISRSGCQLCAESVTKEYWTSCVNGTQDRVRKYGNCFGTKGDVLETRECGGGSSKKWLPFVIVFAIVAVGGLAFFVYRLYRQNTELECKYSHVNTDEVFHETDDAIALPEDDFMRDEEEHETGYEAGRVI